MIREMVVPIVKNVQTNTKRMPTIKQKVAFQKVMESNGKKPMGEIMEEVGYAPSTVNTPNVLTASKGWKELMEQYLPDDKLARKHDELLEHEEGNIQTKALDMAYKLKGAYAPEKSISVNLHIDQVARGELQKIADNVAVGIKESHGSKESDGTGSDNSSGA